MQNISKIRDIVTAIFLSNIIISIVVFIYLYNNVLDDKTKEFHNILFNSAFTFTLVNIIISGSLMIYLYNNLTKWYVESIKNNKTIAECKSLITKIENDKKASLNNDDASKISYEEFIYKFSNCKNLKDIARIIFKEISKKIQITSAIFYVRDSNTEEFIPVSSFAIMLEDVSTFKEGDGLNGEVAKNKIEIILNSLENSYFNIVSGLGVAQPSSLAIFPIIIDDKTEGVVEISTFVKFSQNEIDFLIKLFSGLSKFKNT